MHRVLSGIGKINRVAEHIWGWFGLLVERWSTGCRGGSDWMRTITRCETRLTTPSSSILGKLPNTLKSREILQLPRNLSGFDEFTLLSWRRGLWRVCCLGFLHLGMVLVGHGPVIVQFQRWWFNCVHREPHVFNSQAWRAYERSRYVISRPVGLKSMTLPWLGAHNFRVHDTYILTGTAHEVH